jgi:hypothetical protein
MVRQYHRACVGKASADVLRQPGRQVIKTAEIQQRLSQLFQLLQRQGLDLSGGGITQGAADAVELAQGHGGRFSGTAAGFTAGFTPGFAFQPAFLPPLIQEHLGGAGVE